MEEGCLEEGSPEEARSEAGSLEEEEASPAAQYQAVAAASCREEASPEASLGALESLAAPSPEEGEEA